MPKMQPDRDDHRGGFGQGGPQDGAIGNVSDERQQQQGEDRGRSEQGEGARRHPGGSSRDPEQQR
jgi:hypothetical protein